MYLTQEAIVATLRQIASLASGTTLVMSFLCPIEMLDPEMRIGVERAAEGARANGTPWISFFKPDEMLSLAREAGFKKAQHVSAAALAQRYFALLRISVNVTARFGHRDRWRLGALGRSFRQRDHRFR